MSYQSMFSFAFQNLSGLTLNAKLFDSSGSQTGTTITTGFTDLGDGAYQYLATIPDGHLGTLKIYDSAQPSRCIPLAVNPQEIENADVKTSTLITDIAALNDLSTDDVDARLAAYPVAKPSDVPTTSAINSALALAHGSGAWTTADVSALASQASINALHNLSTADIDSRLAAYPVAKPADVSSAQTAILAAITALNDLSEIDISNLLATYDGATQADLDTAKAAVLAAIAALNNLSQAQVQTAATAALNAYDGPTKAELDAAQAAIQDAIAGIEGGGGGGSSAAEIWTYPDRTLTRFGNMTGIEFTYTVTNSVSGLPLAGVAVWFAVDGGGAQIVWSGHTDALGVARDAYGALPRLDPGTYYVFRSRPGYVFRNPDTEIINE